MPDFRLLPARRRSGMQQYANRNVRRAHKKDTTTPKAQELFWIWQLVSIALETIAQQS
jgi:hypothetical protein